MSRSVTGVDSFGRSAVFAAVAAAAWLPWIVGVGPVLGFWYARDLFLVLITALYIGSLGAPRRRGVAAALVAVMLGGALAAATVTTIELCIGLALVLGVARSAFLYRAAPARAVATEAILLLGGLLFARFLSGPSIISTAFAVWGFLLVQSCFFLVAGVRVRRERTRHADPFEDAYQQATAILDRAGI